MQRLARARQDQEQERAPSKLASLLVEEWAWGAMSAPKVQALAQAAFEDGLTHPQMERLAKMGRRGLHPGNCHRDLLLAAGEHCFTKATLRIPIRLKVKQTMSEPVPLDFLLPHKLFSCMFHSLPQAFIASVLGGSQANIPKFWEAMKNHPQVLSKPQLRDRQDLHRVVPIALHGDGVSYMQVRRAAGKSLEVLSWTSLLCTGPTKISSFLMFCVVKSVVKDFGVSQTWPKVWQVLCWSLQALAAGTWPMQDWEGHDFTDPDSLDYQKRGQPLADGFAAVVFVLRSDLDFLANHFHLSSASSNEPCALCQANRQMDSRPWTDCRPTAHWRATVWDNAAWSLAHPNAHPLLQMPGSGIDLIYPDLMHCKHLGTDQLLLGSVLSWMVRSYLGGTISENLEMIWAYIKGWYKDVWDPACRLCRQLKGRFKMPHAQLSSFLLIARNTGLLTPRSWV